ncbi:MAG: imidazoleglycerol-phosphate dehydratase HisB [Methanopyri archaeon]|nr:imidazoleglycerol-phosphate dehydratase HisB [Methanopyri archaeon]
MRRTGSHERVTEEVSVEVEVDLDGRGRANVDTGIPFFDHMLEQLAFHSQRIDMRVEADGDVDVDDHHTVEDVGLALGAAIDEALGDREGIRRMAWAAVPMDDALVMTAIDVSGRPYTVLRGYSPRRSGIGNPPMSTENVPHFFESLCKGPGITAHIHVLDGKNDHHVIEAVFKSFGRALGEAVEIVTRGVPSTKGLLRG